MREIFRYRSPQNRRFTSNWCSEIKRKCIIMHFSPLGERRERSWKRQKVSRATQRWRFPTLFARTREEEVCQGSNEKSIKARPHHQLPGQEARRDHARERSLRRSYARVAEQLGSSHSASRGLCTPVPGRQVSATAGHSRKDLQPDFGLNKLKSERSGRFNTRRRRKVCEGFT